VDIAVVGAGIAAATRSPERVVGMHFFNPVPAMRLVEAGALGRKSSRGFYDYAEEQATEDPGQERPTEDVSLYA
jgi:3-hydroxybutyryl-CoA dehydrogenase